MKGSQDKFANKFYGYSTETAANTLTFREVSTNVDVFSKTAWILHRLEWEIPQADLDKILGTGDSITLALTSTDKITALGLDSAGVIDRMVLTSLYGSTVAFNLMTFPLIRDFSMLPGGGIIIAPRPLYVAVQGASLASAVTARVRGYFTQSTLSADEYLELVDFYRIVQ